MSREVALPLCRALVAFSGDDYAKCIGLIESVRPHTNRFGGSNAQRDVIGLTQVEAAFRAGMTSTARSLVAERTNYKPSSPFNWQLTARVLSLGGDSSGAAQVRSQAAALIDQSTRSRAAA